MDWVTGSKIADEPKVALLELLYTPGAAMDDRPNMGMDTRELGLRSPPWPAHARLYFERY